MGLTCKIFGHKWRNCWCVRCGAYRDVDHEWNGCKCEICGTVSNERHTWEKSKTEKCTEVCASCGRTRSTGHDWEQISSCLRVCKVCGYAELTHIIGDMIADDYDDARDLYYRDYVCQRCGRRIRKYTAYGDFTRGEECTMRLSFAGTVSQQDIEELKKYDALHQEMKNL